MLGVLVVLIARVIVVRSGDDRNGPAARLTTRQSESQSSGPASETSTTPAEQSPATASSSSSTANGASSNGLRVALSVVTARPVVDSTTTIAIDAQTTDGAVLQLSIQWGNGGWDPPSREPPQGLDVATCGNAGASQYSTTLDHYYRDPYGGTHPPDPQTGTIRVTVTSGRGCATDESVTETMDVTLGYGNGPEAPRPGINPNPPPGNDPTESVVDGSPTDCDGIIVGGVDIDWGDGTTDHEDVEENYGCRGAYGKPYLFRHHYAPGTYTATVTMSSADDRGENIQRASETVTLQSLPQ